MFDDVAATIGTQCRHYSATHPQDTEEIRFEDGLRLHNCGVFNRAPHREAGIVDHGVQSTRLGDHRCDARVNRCIVIDVHFDHFYVASRRQSRGQTPPSAEDAPARRCQKFRARAADTRGGPSDQDHPSGECEFGFGHSGGASADGARRPWSARRCGAFINSPRREDKRSCLMSFSPSRTRPRNKWLKQSLALQMTAESGRHSRS